MNKHIGGKCTLLWKKVIKHIEEKCTLLWKKGTNIF